MSQKETSLSFKEKLNILHEVDNDLKQKQTDHAKELPMFGTIHSVRLLVSVAK